MSISKQEFFVNLIRSATTDAIAMCDEYSLPHKGIDSIEEYEIAKLTADECELTIEELMLCEEFLNSQLLECYNKTMRAASEHMFKVLTKNIVQTKH